jgi:hypothetical protein
MRVLFVLGLAIMNVDICLCLCTGIVWSCGQSVNHCVQAVGVDVGGYWKIRNSWGAAWGEGGYIRLGYGQNICNLISSSTVVGVFQK